MNTKDFHRWTVEEQKELLQSVQINGLEVAAKNFAAEHNLSYKKVYNRASLLKNNGITENKPAQPNPPIADKTSSTLPPKIIIMFAKETMPDVQLDFKAGKLIVKYDENRQLDIKVL